MSAKVDFSMHTPYRIFYLRCFYVLLCAVFYLYPTLVKADTDSLELENLLHLARSQDLAHDPQWLALLHYAPRTVSLSKATRIKKLEFFFSQ